ncbi:MAG: NAD(P)H-hydrate dehydratase [Chloroflexi bacterium]|nr:NAD(P)H-hydrate dehydratase [Chloroflexota bacterium]
MRLVTTAEMRRLEEASVATGQSVPLLMERAGRGVAETARRCLGGVVAGRRVVAMVGPGSNGGDGLVAARWLHDWGARVSAVLSGTRPDDDPHRREILARGIRLWPAEDLAPQDMEALFAPADVALDALLGTGTARPIGPPMAGLLAALRHEQGRRPSLKVLAVDVPSGLDADTGAVDPATPRCDVTVTLGCPKVGLVRFPGAARVGRLEVADIGLAPFDGGSGPELLDIRWVAERLPQRPVYAHKGTFGRVLVVGGSRLYRGAPALAAVAALRTGAGLACVACPASICSSVAALAAEITFLPLAEREGALCGASAAEAGPDLVRYSSVALGCGLSQAGEAREFLERFLASLPAATPLVVDADGLNLLSGWPDWWLRLPPPAVLTPHAGEMARLCGVSPSEVEQDRLVVAAEAASRWGHVVVLKGAHTLIAGPEGEVWVSPFANPALATPGSGDVLAGCIAGLMAQGAGSLNAAACGVFLHGLAGDSWAVEKGSAGLLAGELAALLPGTRRRIMEKGR